MGSTSSKKRDSDETTQNRVLPCPNRHKDVEEISEQNKENKAVRDSSKQETPIKPAGEPGGLNEDRSKPTFWAFYSKAWGLFLKSPETIRAYFGCHNSLYIFATLRF